ncbi:hypothetical protein H4R33_000293 [Dimargaris cristalligena]|nr:hypothetical protein H4R33_000293 [Dimargaris cristalligena]
MVYGAGIKRYPTAWGIAASQPPRNPAAVLPSIPESGEAVSLAQTPPTILLDHRTLAQLDSAWLSCQQARATRRKMVQSMSKHADAKTGTT